MTFPTEWKVIIQSVPNHQPVGMVQKLRPGTPEIFLNHVTMSGGYSSSKVSHQWYHWLLWQAPNDQRPSGLLPWCLYVTLAGEGIPNLSLWNSDILDGHAMLVHKGIFNHSLGLTLRYCNIVMENQHFRLSKSSIHGPLFQSYVKIPEGYVASGTIWLFNIAMENHHL